MYKIYESGQNDFITVDMLFDVRDLTGFNSDLISKLSKQRIVKNSDFTVIRYK